MFQTSKRVESFAIARLLLLSALGVAWLAAAWLFVEGWYSLASGLLAIGSCALGCYLASRLLTQSSALGKAWLDGVPYSAAAIDRQGSIRAVNSAWRQFARENGMTCPRYGVGTNYLQLLTEFASGEDSTSLNPFVEGMRRCLSGEIPSYEYVYACDSPDARRWFRIQVMPSSVVGYTIVSHENITELRRAEEESQRYSSTLQAVLHSTLQPMLLSSGTQVVECNQAALQLLGLRSTAELYNLPLEMDSHIRRALSTGSDCFEWEFRRGDGRVIWVEVALSRFDYLGTPSVYVSLNDTSERKRLDSEQRVLNERLEQDLRSRIQTEKILRSTASYLDVYHKIVDRHAIVAETDNAGNIVHANDAFCRISGYTRAELIGKNHRILNSGLHPKSMWREMFRQVVTEGVWHGEVCNRAKNGELYWVDTTVVPLLNDVGKVKGYFAIRTDITGLKKAQAAAEAANIAKSEFLANMSHEIRTPMTAILGFADLIGDDSIREDSERWREFVRTIKRNGEHLLSIINDILDLSKIEAQKLVLEKLCANTRCVVDSVIDLMMVKATGKGLQLRAQIDGNVPTFIHTDPTRLRQILLNLIGNAIKFTELGSVTLSVRVDPTDSHRLEFEVCDTGIGMTEEQKARLFQAFEQADASMTRKFGGTGLGLRISERLASMLGGKIEVSSERNVGSTFTLTVHAPACSEAELAEADAHGVDCHASEPSADRQPKPASRGAESTEPLKGIRILLVEDGPDNQRLISFLLKKAGASVVVADNGLAAVELVSVEGDRERELQSPVPFDLILMDMQMPIMDGYEATRTLRAKGWLGPILSLTAHAMSHDLEHCIESGCNAHLTKPIDKAELYSSCLKWSDPETERSAMPVADPIS